MGGPDDTSCYSLNLDGGAIERSVQLNSTACFSHLSSANCPSGYLLQNIVNGMLQAENYWQRLFSDSDGDWRELVVGIYVQFHVSHSLLSKVNGGRG